MAKMARPTFAVPTDIMPAFKRYVVAKQIFEIAEARMEAEKSVINRKMVGSFAESLVKMKCRPANPRLTLAADKKPDIEGLFQVQEKFTPQMAQGDTPVVERLKEAFLASGVSQDTADKVLANEVTCEDKTTLRPFGELMQGAPIEQDLAGRVMKLLLDNFTEDERKLLIRPAEKVEVKEGFLERLGVYVKDLTEAVGVLRVMKPTAFLSHMKLGLSDSPQGRLNRLYDYAKELILGEAS